MTGLQQEGHDRADDEDGLESFAEDDEKTLPERLGARTGRLRQRDHPRHVRFERIARALGAVNVTRLDISFEFGVECFYRGEDARIARARGRFDRLEREVGIERTIARFRPATV